MNKQQKCTPIRLTAILMAALYLFITALYLFKTPGFQNRQTTYITKVKSNTQFIYSLIRTNRCLAAGKKSSKPNWYPLPGSMVALFSKTGRSLHVKMDGAFATQFLPGNNSIYLSNRVLRI